MFQENLDAKLINSAKIDARQDFLQRSDLVLTLSIIPLDSSMCHGWHIQYRL